MDNPTQTLCPQCDGAQYRLTEHGWTRCECWWKERILKHVPAVLRGSNEQYLPASVRKSAPWPVDGDQHERGDWTSFRRRAWWSLASALVAGQIVKTEVVDTDRLVGIVFQRDAQFAHLRELVDLQLLILVGGLEPSRYKDFINDLTQSLLRLRRFYDRPTWSYGIPVALTDLPLFPDAPRSQDLDATPVRFMLPERGYEVPALPSLPPASQSDLLAPRETARVYTIHEANRPKVTPEIQNI